MWLSSFLLEIFKFRQLTKPYTPPARIQMMTISWSYTHLLPIESSRQALFYHYFITHAMQADNEKLGKKSSMGNSRIPSESVLIYRKIPLIYIYAKRVFLSLSKTALTVL